MEKNTKLTQTAAKALPIIEEFRKIDKYITSPRMAMMLYLAQRGETSVKDLEKFLDITGSATQKQLKALLTEEIVQVRQVADPYPRGIYTLTRKGERIIESLDRYFSPIN